MYGQGEREEKNISESYKIKLNYSSRIYPLDDLGNKIKENDSERILEESSGNASIVQYKKIESESSVEIQCKAKTTLCDWNSFILYPEIDYSNYKLEVELKNLENNSELKKFVFNVFSLNPKFFNFIFMLKIIFLILSIVSFAFYHKFYKTLNSFICTFEHKALYYLSISLVLFNDPLGFITIYQQSLILDVISSLTSSIFLSTLIYFWIIMLERIHKEPTTPETQLHKSKKNLLFGKYI